MQIFVYIVFYFNNEIGREEEIDILLPLLSDYFPNSKLLGNDAGVARLFNSIFNDEKKTLMCEVRRIKDL